MRYLTFLFLLFFIGLPDSIYAQTQLTKKDKKEIETDIRFQYEFGDYQRVCDRAHGLAGHYDGPIAMDIFLMWEEACYTLRDFALSAPMLRYYRNQIEDSKKEKKVDQNIKMRLDTLSRVYDIVFRHEELLDQDNRPLEKKVVLDSLFRITDHYWQIWYDLMSVHYNLKNYDEAIRYGTVVDRIKPDHHKTNIVLAFSYYHSQHFDNTLKYLKRIKTLDRESQGLFAWTYYMKQDYRNSLRYLDMLISEDSSNRGFWVLKMQNHEFLGEAQESFNTGVQIVLLKPDTLDYPVLGGIGRAFHQLYDDKVGEMTEMVEKHPDALMFRYIRMRYLNPQNPDQYAVGMKDFDHLIAYDSSNPELYNLKGNFIYTSNPDMEGRRLAEEQFLKSIELEPNDFDNHDKLNRLFMWKSPKTARFHKANTIRAMRTWTREYPDSGRAYYYLAQAFDLADNGTGSLHKWQDSTVKYLDIALEKGMDSLYVIRERMYYRSGYGRTIEDEILDLKWVLDHIDSGYRRKNALYRMADIYTDRKQYQEAIDIYYMIIEENPKTEKYVKPKIRNLKAKM